MTPTDIRNPKYANAEQTLIDCEVEFDNSGEYFPFTCDPNDQTTYSQAIWSAIQSGVAGEIAAYEAPSMSITAADVLAERSRRLALGFDYDFGEPRGVHHIGTTPEDMAGWDEVSKYASALLANNQGTTQINILTDTGPIQVTAAEWQLVLIASAQFRQPIWAASFVLQAMNPIPADYASNDAYWQ